jgi:flagellin
MPLNSVNTNMGAMVALESLNLTNQQLQATQKQISTGYRVADATDNGAAYAVAQSIRSNVAGLTSANQQLSQTSSGLLSTTLSGLNSISTQMTSLQATLVKLSDGSLSTTERTQYQTNVTNDLANIKNYITDSNYNGKSLIGNFGASPGFGSVNVVRNEQGAQYTIGTSDGSAIYKGLTALGNAAQTSTQIAAALTATGAFTTQFNAVSSALNTYGNASNYVTSQVTFNSNRIDAMNSGLGALVDANLSQEAANLQALQTRQQLGTQALSLANQAPNSLLSLFK